MKYAQSTFWTIASRAVAVGAQIGFFLVVAGDVGPAIFGVFALASAIVYMLTRIAAAGWQEYATTYADAPTQLSECWRAAALAGILATALCAALALGVAQFEEHILFALIVAALLPSMLIAPVCSVSIGVLIGREKLVPLAYVSILADVLASICAAIAFVMGAGIWTLIVQKLVQSVVSLCGSHILARLAPAGLPVWPGATLRRFYRTFFITGSLAQLSENTGLLAVGWLTGNVAAGIYRSASRLSSAAIELANEAATRIAWARFGNHARSPNTSREGSLFSAFVFALTAPVFVGLSLVSSPVVALFLGPEWAPAGPVLAMLALAGGLRAQLGALPPTLTAQHRFRSLVWIMLLPAIAVVIAMVVAAPLGLRAIAVGVVVAEGVSLTQRFIVAHRIGHLDAALVVKLVAKPALAVIAMALAVKLIVQTANPETALLELVTAMGTGAVAWSLAMAVVFRNEFRGLLSAQLRNARP